MERGNTDNIVIVLASHNEWSWDEARRQTCQIINKTVAEFQHTESQLLSSEFLHSLYPEDRMKRERCLASMKDWMRGSLDWHYRTAR